MAKYIAHASLGSNGKITGDIAGDQGAEVCIRTWYNKSWNQFFHIKNDAVRKQFGNNMIDIANNKNVGYDQNGRNTLLTQAIKVNFDFTKIAVKCECDCSSMVTIALLGAIYKVLGKAAYNKAYAILVPSGNCATTSTFKAVVAKLKSIVAITCYTATTYTRSTSKAVFGDIYNKAGSHIVAYIDNGKKCVDAKVTVKEWQEAAIKDGFEFPMYGADGDFGDECEDVAAKAIIKKRTSNGKAVYKYPNLTRIVQKVVGVEADGCCGDDTAEAIEVWQKANGLEADGCIGLKSWKKILGVK